MLHTDATYTTKGRWGGYYTYPGPTTFWAEGKGSVLNCLTLAKTHSQNYLSHSPDSAFTMSIFETSPRGSPVHVVYGCNVNWAANTVYRTLHVPSSTKSRKTSTTASNPTTLVHTPAIPTPTSTDSTSPSPEVTSAPKSSQAWIAGAVVGPVAGCALVGVLVWWITRYRKRAAATKAAESAAAKTTSGPYQQRQHQQPLGLWPTASPPPSQGPTTRSSASGGTAGSQNDLLNVPGSMGRNGEVYEMHHTYR
ncbi:hypothetical protein PG996_004236 [Apiospora saccharicola]|uniref:Uncharacterized protein n=1 Tax=Apiospora saccharicola TaxID=335842 RepID=A0ABR1W6A5_9PEZI